MVNLTNFSYDFDLNDDEDTNSKIVDLYITCKNSSDAVIIMGELMKALGATNCLLDLGRDKR